MSRLRNPFKKKKEPDEGVRKSGKKSSRESVLVDKTQQEVSDIMCLKGICFSKIVYVTWFMYVLHVLHNLHILSWQRMSSFNMKLKLYPNLGT